MAVQLGWPYPKRIKHFEEVSKAESQETYSIRFQGKYRALPVYEVSIDLPKYRLENGRTSAAQDQYLATTKGVAKDLFRRDPEDDEAQEAQHGILKKMIDGAGLHDYFKTREQEDPIVLTHEGFVINGNRRLCSYREHLASNPKKFQRFRNIRIIILPVADDKELDWLEGKEQLQQDITDAYSWTAQAIMFRRRMADHKLKLKDLEAIYEIKTAKIKELLDMLDHAEIYLQSIDKMGQYTLVDGDEFAFRRLRNSRKNIKETADQEVYDNLCYTVIEKPLANRVYQTVADIQKHFKKIKDGIQAELVLPDQKSGKRQPKRKSTILGGSKSLPPDVLDVVADNDNRAKVREIVEDVIQSETINKKERKGKNFVSSQVETAVQALQKAVDNTSKKGSKSEKSGVPEKLKMAEELIAKLKTWADAKSKS